MSYIDFKEVTSNTVGSATKYGGNDIKEVMQILNGKVVANKRVKILNEWIFMDHFDIKSSGSVPPAPTDTNTNRLYTDPTDFKLKVRKTSGGVVDLEATGTSGATNLDGLTDVVISSPSNTQVLTYNGTNWANMAAPGGGGGGDVFLNQANTHGDFNNTFRSSRLLVRNPANTFSFLLAGSAIAADRTITFPLLTVNDIAVTEAFPQPLTNKTIVATSNTISAIGDANIASHTTTKITTTAKGQLNSAIAYNDQANTFGAFDQTFKSSRLIVRNPADTFSYIFAGSAIVANRTITWPLLTGNDNAVTEAFAQPLTNKTVNVDQNTIKHSTTNGAGTILTNNATQFVPLVRGTALQVLRVNSGGTDIQWASLDSERIGKHTASGNGATVTFNIAHGLGSNPTYCIVSVAQSGSTAINRSYTTDSTNIVVTFASAPSSGTNNVIINWIVVA